MTDRQTGRQTNRHLKRKTEGEKQKHIYIYIYKYFYIYRERMKERNKEREREGESIKVYDAHTGCSLFTRCTENRTKRKEKDTPLSGSDYHRTPQDIYHASAANTTTTGHQRAAVFHNEHTETINCTACISQRLTPRVERLTCK